MVSNRRLTTAITVVIVAMTAISVFCMDDPWYLKLALLLPCVAIGCRRIPRPLSGIDIAVLLIWVSDVAQCLTSVNASSSVLSLGPSTTALAVYALVRCGTNRRMLVSGICCIGLILAITMCGTFIVFKRAVLDAAFENSYNFRYLLNPMGLTLNMATSMLLITSGFCFIGKSRWAVAAGTLVCFAIMLSFSRGAILSLMLMAVMTAIFVRPWKEGLKLTVAIATAAVVAGTCCPKEFSTAIGMNRTASQQQSTMARINGMETALQTFMDKPITGHGQGNYMMATDRLNDPCHYRALTNMAPNWLSQIAVEKGATGLALYAALVAVAAMATWRGRHRRTTMVCACTLTALAFKEMTQSTMLYNTGGMTLTCIMLALLQPESTERRYSANTATAITAILALCLTALCSTSYRTTKLYRQTANAAALSKKGEFEKALFLLDNCGTDPYLETAKAVVEINAYTIKGDTAMLSRAYNRLQPSGQTDKLNASLAEYTKMLKGDTGNACNSDISDPTGYYKARVLYTAGEKIQATNAMARYVTLTPALLDIIMHDTMLTADTAFMQQLQATLLADKPGKNATPAENARYGYTAFRLGDTLSAEQSLLKATAQMPSYSTPWRILGQISEARGDTAQAHIYHNRHRLLSNGILWSGKAAGNAYTPGNASPQWRQTTTKYAMWHHIMLPSLSSNP